jgi:hypothetical protein
VFSVLGTDAQGMFAANFSTNCPQVAGHLNECGRQHFGFDQVRKEGIELAGGVRGCVARETKSIPAC